MYLYTESRTQKPEDLAPRSPDSSTLVIFQEEYFSNPASR